MSTSPPLIDRQAPPLVGTHSSTGDGSPQHFLCLHIETKLTT